ncbi:MAG: rane protein [Myxococcaceae bacterium]|nr:rane protein [Myxococcaceae bacterium]
MTDFDRSKYLRPVLRSFGLIFIFGLYPLTVYWPSGWSWHTGPSEQMIIALYATLGFFLILAAGNPENYVSLVSFTIWSSIVHGLLMAFQSLAMPEHMHHLCGDVPALFVIAAALGYLSPSAFRLPLSAAS